MSTANLEPSVEPIRAAANDYFHYQLFLSCLVYKMTEKLERCLSQAQIHKFELNIYI